MNTYKHTHVISQNLKWFTSKINLLMFAMYFLYKFLMLSIQNYWYLQVSCVHLQIQKYHWWSSVWLVYTGYFLLICVGGNFVENQRNIINIRIRIWLPLILKIYIILTKNQTIFLILCLHHYIILQVNNKKYILKIYKQMTYIMQPVNKFKEPLNVCKNHVPFGVFKDNLKFKK